MTAHNAAIHAAGCSTHCFQSQRAALRSGGASNRPGLKIGHSAMKPTTRSSQCRSLSLRQIPMRAIYRARRTSRTRTTSPTRRAVCHRPLIRSRAITFSSQRSTRSALRRTRGLTSCQVVSVMSMDRMVALDSIRNHVSRGLA